ncbi:MAG TPA: large conductance mechanosensitive channel protein MscL [Terriglobales bacterium]|nr:large conductance mechanosensitive channel protein MscL [Terriglobales bacterium]
MVGEFRGFLLKNNVMALATGFILGAAVGKVVTALVNDLIMPFVGMVTPSGEWRQITFEIGSGKFLVGDFAGAVVDFAIIALVVFLIAKAMFKPEPGPATKNCPACTEPIAAAATRCKWCTQAV